MPSNTPQRFRITRAMLHPAVELAEVNTAASQVEKCAETDAGKSRQAPLDPVWPVSPAPGETADLLIGAPSATR